MRKILSFILVLCILATVIPVWPVGIIAAEPTWDIEDDFDTCTYDATSKLLTKHSDYVDTTRSSDVSAFAVATSAQSWTDDVTRLYRATATTPVPYITYYLGGNDITYFKVLFGSIVDAYPRVRIHTSEDGETFKEMNAADVVYDETASSSNWRAVTLTPTTVVPAGAKYIRLQFEDGQAGNTNRHQHLQICKAYFSSSTSIGEEIALTAAVDEAEQLLASVPPSLVPQAVYNRLVAAIADAKDYLNTGYTAAYAAALSELETAIDEFSNAISSGSSVVDVIVDDCVDFSKVLRTIGNVAVTTSSQTGLDDGNRFNKTSAHSGVSVIYTSGDRYYDYVQVDAWYQNIDGKYATGDMLIEVSTDDVIYTAVTATKTANTSGWSSGFRLHTFRAENLPLGTKYVKTTFADTTSTGQFYTVQIGRIEFGVKYNYKLDIARCMDEATSLLEDVTVGVHCTQTEYDKLSAEVQKAEEVFNRTNDDNELKAAYDSLLAEITLFRNTMTYTVEWPANATIEAAEVSHDMIRIEWPEISGAFYHIYQNDILVAMSYSNTYTASSLIAGIDYTFRIVAEKFNILSEELGPVTIITTGGFRFSPPDFSKISPDDFDDEDYLGSFIRRDDTRNIPYYYYHLHTVLNGVVMTGTNKGFVNVWVNRDPQYNKTYNARVQEVYLPIAYFYSRNEPWNIYYGDPNVKEVLEAIIEYALKLQRSDGPLPENSASDYSLAPTNFFINFITQAVRLLKEEEQRNSDFPSINPVLMDELQVSIRKAIKFSLESTSFRSHGLNFSNQYGLIWNATAAYLRLYPDEEIENLLKREWAKAGDFISPAGFYYEDSFDMGYNLNVHINTLIGEYYYFKDTEFEGEMIDHQTRFIDWLSYNLVMEPDGSMFIINGAPSHRTDSSGVSLIRKTLPIAEKIPLARAFVRTDQETEEEVERNKAAMTANGSWPNIPDMAFSANAYEPFSIYEKLFDDYAPTEEERQAAIETLPYIASEQFTQFRKDSRSSNSAFSFIRKPSYYTIFNAGSKSINQTVYGMGLLWHPEGGIMITSLTENERTTDYTPRKSELLISNNLSWGTRSLYEKFDQEGKRIYEAEGALIPTSYKIDGEIVSMANGIHDMPDGDLEIKYTLGSGTLDKTVTYKQDDMEVKIIHPGRFQECFPLAVRPEDKFEVHENKFTLIRGRTVMEIEFNKPVGFEIMDTTRTNNRFQYYMLRANATNNLTYNIRMFTRDPQLGDNPSNVQVSIDDIVTRVEEKIPDVSDDGQTAETTEDGDMFADISTHWARNDINYLAKEGYIEGISDGMFNPEGAITRAEFIEMVINAFDIILDTSGVIEEFADIPKDTRFYIPVLAARQKGIVRGISSDMFAPYEVIATQEMELIALRAYQYILGLDDTRSSATSTRGQAAAVLKRLLDDIAAK